MTTLLDRCAALIEKIKRGPEWTRGRTIRCRLVYDASEGEWWVERKTIGGWRVWYSVSDHEAIALIEKWLRRELVELGYSAQCTHITCLVIDRRDGYTSPAISVDDDELTALITAAEKVLVEAVT